MNSINDGSAAANEIHKTKILTTDQVLKGANTKNLLIREIHDLPALNTVGFSL